MEDWDHATDVVVVGSGAAGLSAALTAHGHGLQPLILERASLVGGSSALAGGGMWVPANRWMRADGAEDSTETALTYLDAVVEDVGPSTSRARKEAFVHNAPRAIEFLEQQGMQFRRTTGYPDYYPDAPGGSADGRGIESVVFDMREVGPWNGRLPKRHFPRTLPMGTLDVSRIVVARRTLPGFLRFARILAQHLWSKVRGRSLAGGGSALIGQLLHEVLRRGLPVWVESRLVELVMDDGRVAGVVVERDGRRIRVRANRAVHLGAGGFARNPEMRKEHQPQPNAGAWTSAAAQDMGDGIRLGVEVGAATALMDEAWWGPASVMPDGTAIFHVSERSKPGSLIVDATGERYMNEAQSYIDAVHAMYERNAAGTAIPSWLIFDATYRNRYPFGTLLPGITPKRLVEAGYLNRASSLEELARKVGIDPAGLARTVERFNGMAADGVDRDFARGGNAYDRYYGDPRVTPNPCLAPVARGPFYAVALYPGDLGTKGGLVTDEVARVLREDGTPIPGLYASGNTTASVMGRTYPGPGVTLAPAVTFAFLGMEHAATALAADAPAPR